MCQTIVNTDMSPGFPQITVLMYDNGMDPTLRADIRPGLAVVIVQKHHQKTGAFTQGVVQDILTSAAVHPRGIKVQLTTGEVGRVQAIQE